MPAPEKEDPQIGWYSAKAAETGNLYIYETPDGKGQLKCTCVGAESRGHQTAFKDVVCLGPVGRYVKTIRNERLQ